MKNFQQNLLIALALGLCCLCVWQWYFQTTLRDTITKRDQSIYKLSSDIEGYTNSIKNMDTEIAALQSRVTELKRDAVSNGEVIITQQRDLLRLRSSTDILSNEIVQYQSATNFLETHLQAAYDGVKKQNEAIKQLVAQRDEFVQKFNDSIKARNELTEKYNALVERINKQQAAPAQ